FATLSRLNGNKKKVGEYFHVLVTNEGVGISDREVKKAFDGCPLDPPISCRAARCPLLAGMISFFHGTQFQGIGLLRETGFDQV
ncbi:MAG: hypothetical protein RRA15_11395, partial [bacterium]|nr:hypothetical protein [bacterium]